MRYKFLYYYYYYYYLGCGPKCDDVPVSVISHYVMLMLQNLSILTQLQFVETSGGQ